MESALEVTLPEHVRDWLEDQARAGGHPTPGDYVRQLLEAEQRRLARAEIDEQLQAGLSSGPATPLTAADWKQLRRRARQQLATRRKKS